MKKTLIVILFIIFSIHLFSQGLKGVHQIRNFLPEDYNGHPQVFSIVQDKNGIIYIGTVGNGIFQYDGVNWTNIPDSTESAVYSMDIDSEGVIYCGRHNDLAYLERLQNGQMKIKSLNYLLEDTSFFFQAVWTTKVYKNKVYFLSYEAVFEYEIGTKNKIKIYPADESYLLGLFFSNNRIFVREDKKGLLELKNERLEPLENGDFLKDYKYTSIIDYSKDSSLISTRFWGSYFFKPQNNSFSKFEFEDENFFENNQPYRAEKLSNSYMAIASLAKGVLVTDSLGKNIAKLNDKTNLKSNYILNVFSDNQNNLWIGSSNGVSVTDYDFDLTYWNSDNGFSGTVENIIKYNDFIYIATESTVYYIKDDVVNEVEGITKGQFWDFLIFETENTSKLLTSGSTGVYEIDFNSAKQIYAGNQAMVLHQSGKDPNRVFTTDGYSNFISLYFDGQNFEFETVWDIVDEQVRRIVEHNGEIWFLIFRKGIAKAIEFDTVGKLKKISYYGVEKGLPEVSCEIYNYKNKLIAATGVGYFQYNADLDSFVVYDGFGSFFFEQKLQVYYMSSFNNKILVAPSQNKVSPIGILTPNEKNEFDWLTEPFKNLPNMIIYSAFADSNEFWIGGTEGIFRYKRDLDNKNYTHKFNTLIRKVTINKDSIIYFGNLQKNNLVNTNEIEFQFNSIKFDFAAVYFTKSDKNVYQYKLENFDEEWSEWSAETYKEYSFLPHGEYTFYVKSKNIYGTESEVASFTFKISAPWYKTVYAYIGYGLIGILLVFILIKLFTRRLIKQKEKLEEIVYERTQEIRNQNEEIQAQAEQLLDINKELEKLSIVAAETDNVIVIMDNEGNFEWFNDAFTKLYGYSGEEFKMKYKNIVEASSNPEIKQTIHECINEGKPKIYESVSVSKNGEKVWVQTTLSPILDPYREVEKIIAIESDIRKLKKVEQELKIKNQHITESITYAKTIQNAILPFDEIMSKYFDNFILFKPKDIVSGDFYWYVNSEKYHFIAAVDCTGHGVPGAFMSMIGSSLLNQIVYDNKEFKTSKILEELDKLVYLSLRQDKTENNDGMDVCLCRIEKYDEMSKVQFSGAKRPLIYWSNAESKIEIAKGDRRSIGGRQKSKNLVNFTAQEFVFTKKDVIYLSSDGFVDQNNTERKKYGTTQLTTKLSEIALKPTEEQFKILNLEIKNWMNKTDQRDDITIIGVKI